MRHVGRFVTIGLTLAAVALAGLVGWAFLTNPDLASKELDTYNWIATDTGFTFEEAVSRDQSICICRAHECQANIEPVHITYEEWLRRYYVIIRDPSGRDRADWGRSVVAEAACVTKRKGESVRYILTEVPSSDSLGETTNTSLLLTLE